MTGIVRWARQSEPAALAVPVLGRIDGCTHPESAELLADGEHIAFGNCAMTLGIEAYRRGAGLVYLSGDSFISTARVESDGGLELLERQCISGLTATLGCDVLRRATKRFPDGTVFMAAGGNPIVRAGETTLLVDPALQRSQLLACDALRGELLGSIPLYPGSAIARRFNPIDQPNGLAVNREGDLFFGDIPNSNPATVLPPPAPSAVYRIRHADIDALAMAGPDAESAAARVQRVLVPGFVNGVTVAHSDGATWIVSCSSHDEARGAAYRLSDEDFERGVLPPPVVAGLGVLDGIGITRRGTLFVSNPRTGQIHVFLQDGSHRLLQLLGPEAIGTPADINVCYPKFLGGEPALLAPDVSVTAKAGEGSVTLLDISGL